MRSGLCYGLFAACGVVLTKKKVFAMVIHGHQHVDAETVVGDTTVIGAYGYKVCEVQAISAGHILW